MSEEWEDNNDENANVPKALRDAYDRMKQELAAERTRSEQLAGQVRQTTIKDLLTSQGYSPDIAAVVPTDVEAKEEPLKAWLDQHSAIFVKAPPLTESATIPDQAPPQGIAPPVQDRMGAAVAAGLPSGLVNSLEAQIDQAATSEDLDKVMEQYRHVRFKA